MMAMQNCKVKTSFYIHTEEVTTANKTNTENYVKAAEQTMYPW